VEIEKTTLMYCLTDLLTTNQRFDTRNSCEWVKEVGIQNRMCIMINTNNFGS